VNNRIAFKRETPSRYIILRLDLSFITLICNDMFPPAGTFYAFNKSYMCTYTSTPTASDGQRRYIQYTMYCACVWQKQVSKSENQQCHSFFLIHAHCFFLFFYLFFWFVFFFYPVPRCYLQMIIFFLPRTNSTINNCVRWLSAVRTIIVLRVHLLQQSYLQYW